MPCYSDSPNLEQETLDTITRLACDRCQDLEARGEPVPEWAAGWWAKHKDWDRAREEHVYDISDPRTALDMKAKREAFMKDVYGRLNEAVQKALNR